MKTLLAAAILVSTHAFAGTTNSDSTGRAGDHLDLSGVLELFKQSSSMEAFEKSINDEKNQVNNLDLNGDGEVDYIRVVDHREKDDHAIVLQIPVNEKESQDVASIEIEKTGESTAQLQIVGDEDVYGEKYYVEPKEDDADKSKFMRLIVVNVWMWPCVRFIYAPKYVLWVSPWRWRVYPPYWKPWRCVAWNVHHRRVVRYHAHCHRVYTHRVVRAHKIYHRHRVVSPAYHKRYHAPKNAGAPRHKTGPNKSHKTGPGNRNPNRKSPAKRTPARKSAPTHKGGGRK